MQVAVENYNSIQKEYSLLVNNRSQLQAQLSENKAVLSEISGESVGQIYKLLGPVLLKIDSIEANSNVEKRIEFVGREIGRMDEMIKGLEVKSEGVKKEIMELQSKEPK